jgi:hypothetical protein
LAFTPPLKAYQALTMPATLAFGEHANPIVKTIAARLAERIPLPIKLMVLDIL